MLFENDKNMKRDLSLVPRHFPPPVFDHLQYAKPEEEGLASFPGSLEREMYMEQRSLGTRLEKTCSFLHMIHSTGVTMSSHL